MWISRQFSRLSCVLASKSDFLSNLRRESTDRKSPLRNASQDPDEPIITKCLQAKAEANRIALASLSRPARPLPRRDFFPRGAREAGQTTTLLVSIHSSFQGATLCRLALAMHAHEIVSRSCTISRDPALEEIAPPRPSSTHPTFPQRWFWRITHRGLPRHLGTRVLQATPRAALRAAAEGPALGRPY